MGSCKPSVKRKRVTAVEGAQRGEGGVDSDCKYVHHNNDK